MRLHFTHVEQQGCIRYRLEPSLECWTLPDQLAICYDDPLRRDAVYALVRAADQERQFRAWLAVDRRATEGDELVLG